MVHRVEIVGRGEEVNADLVAFLFEVGRPVAGQGGLFVDLIDRLLPGSLVGKLLPEGAEAVIGDDFGGEEVLEFGRVRAGFLGKADEQFSAF